MPKFQFSRDVFLQKAKPFLFIAPFFIAYLVFFAYPVVFSFFLSFQKWNGILPMQFNGVKNYLFLLSDPRFLNSLRSTFVIFLCSYVPINLLALVFAFILNSALVRFKEEFRTVFFLPYITSPVAVAMVFALLFGTQYGLVNYVLGSEWVARWLPFLKPVNWFMSGLGTVPLCLLIIWRWTGWFTLLYLAGLQNIPKSLYEAALVDGASHRQVFFHITLPLLRPMIYVCATLSIINGMQLFDEPAVLFGGPQYVGQMGVTVALYLYSKAFNQGAFGIASAASYVLFMIIILLWCVNDFIFRDKREKGPANGKN